MIDLSVLASLLTFWNTFGGNYASVSAIKSKKDFENLFAKIDKLETNAKHTERHLSDINEKCSTLSQKITVKEDSLVIRRTDGDTKRFSDYASLHTQAQSLDQYIGEELVSSALIWTPQWLREMISSNPEKFLWNIESLDQGIYIPKQSDLVSVIFDDRGKQYLGWQKKGVLEAICKFRIDDEHWYTKNMTESLFDKTRTAHKKHAENNSETDTQSGLPAEPSFNCKGGDNQTPDVLGESLAYNYFGDEIPLLAGGIIVRVLHDNKTAVIGSKTGELTAIDLVTGKVLDTVMAEPELGKNRPGCGEIKYIEDCFLFLELGHRSQTFMTMGHGGTLKTWQYATGFTLISTVEILAPHHQILHNAIKTTKQRASLSTWSCWTVYSQDIPTDVPNGIMSVKLADDKGTLVCLTDWFAVFRCDLGGRMKDPPSVIPDAFAIEPANADGTEVWVGIGSLQNRLIRYHLSNGQTLQHAHRSADATRNGIHVLSSEYLNVGSWFLHQSDLRIVADRQINTGSVGGPLVVPRQGLLITLAANVIHVYNLDTLKPVGMPLVGGHQDKPLCAHATSDGAAVISVSASSMFIWDLAKREPVGGYGAEGTVLRHGLHNHLDPILYADGDTVLYRGHGDGNQVIAIDIKKQCYRQIPFLDGLAFLIVVYFENTYHGFAFEKKLGKHPTGWKGKLMTVFDAALPVEHFLVHQETKNERPGERHFIPLKGRKGVEFYPTDTKFVDLMEGQVALLTCGHVALYSIPSRAFICGPVDVSGPSDAALSENSHWHTYSHMAVSPDKTRLFVRGRKRPIKVLDATNLTEIATIEGSEGEEEWLLLGDSNDVLFFTQKSQKEYGQELYVSKLPQYNPPRKIVRLRGSCYRQSYNAVPLFQGKILAIVHHKKIDFIDIEVGEYLAVSLEGHGDSIDSIHLSADNQWLISTSQDGTCRFWHCDDIRKKLRYQ